MKYIVHVAARSTVRVGGIPFMALKSLELATDTNPEHVGEGALGKYRVISSTKNPMAKNDLLATLGRNVKRYRKLAGLTQGELAEMVGLHRTSVTNIERGIQDTPVSQLTVIGAVLGVSLSKLTSD